MVFDFMFFKQIIKKNNIQFGIKKTNIQFARHRWLAPIILATWGAEIRRILV
jgi:hypothetical protein